MVESYVPVLVFILLAAVIGVAPVVAGLVLAPSRPDPAKLSAFEDSRMKFDVRYYLVAILFIIFDLEIAFLFPWSIVLDQVGVFGFIAMGIFVGILLVGFLYEWKKGALEWE